MQNQVGTISADQPLQISTSKQTQIFSAAILGFLIILVVGLAPMDVAHNAAHDARHSFAFPCH